MGVIDKVIASAESGAAQVQEPPVKEGVNGSTARQPGEADKKKAGGSTLTITPDSVMSKLTLDAKQRQQLQRIVLAGKKVMFSEQTFGMVMDALNSPEGDLVQKLGTGITGLMSLLIQESKNSLPGEMVIPAGLVLMAEAAQFLAEAGEEITDRDLADAMEIFVTVVLHQTGMDPEKMKAVGEQAAANAGQQSAAPAEPDPQAPAQEVPQ